MGLVLLLVNIKLPSIVSTCFEGFANALGPISMLVMGMLIGEMNLKDVFKQKKAYLICCYRLIILPIICIIVIRYSGFLTLHTDAKQIILVVIIATVAPSASLITQIAQVHGKDGRYASIINVMTVIFSIITMPLMIFLYQWL